MRQEEEAEPEAGHPSRGEAEHAQDDEGLEGTTPDGRITLRLERSYAVTGTAMGTEKPFRCRSRPFRQAG